MRRGSMKARGFDETGQRLRLFGQRSEDRDCLVEHPDVAGRLFQHARILSHMVRFGSRSVNCNPQTAFCGTAETKPNMSVVTTRSTSWERH